MINKDIFDALVTLLGDGQVEIPNIEQIRAITKVNKASKEERERNREINIITAKIRGQAACGRFDLGESVYIADAANISALEEAGYILTEIEEGSGFYDISWSAEVTDDVEDDIVESDKSSDEEGSYENDESEV